MTPRTTPETIEQWLDEATRGLSATAQTQVIAELTAHYADAVEDYQLGGMAEAEARTAALADLGEANETARPLREAHTARRWYIAAAAVSTLFSILVLVAFTIGEPMSPSALGKIVEDALILLPTFFILLVFARLLRQRTGTRDYDAPIAALIAAMCLANGAIDLRLMIFPAPHNSFPWELTPGPAMIPIALSTAGLFATSLSLFWLGTRLLDLPDGLYGLRRAVLTTSIITGLAVVAFALGVMSGDFVMAELGNMVALIAHLVIVALLALVFIRVVTRPSGRKLQAA